MHAAHACACRMRAALARWRLRATRDRNEKARREAGLSDHGDCRSVQTTRTWSACMPFWPFTAT